MNSTIFGKKLSIQKFENCLFVEDGIVVKYTETFSKKKLFQVFDYSVPFGVAHVFCLIFQKYIILIVHVVNCFFPKCKP